MTIALNIALALSVLSLLPSAAAFTPMVYVSGLTTLIAVFGIWQGHVRRGALTIFFAISAAIVSPIVFGIEPAGRWLIAQHLVGTLSAVVMYWDYRRQRSLPD